MKSCTLILLICVYFVSLSNGNQIPDDVFDIVGGHKSERGTWPWMVSITYRDLGLRECGGSIVDKNWIVTAGHCFSKYIEQTDWTIEVGGYENNDVVKKFQVEKVFIHERFDQQNHTFNDIALVRLNSTVDLIQKDSYAIKLANYDDAEGINSSFTRCSITGWGAPGVREDPNIPGQLLFEQSEFLKEADVPMVDIYECSKQYRPFELDPNTQICAGGGGVGTCFGDSGSALQCYNNDLKSWYLFGITSFGRPCARVGIPDVFTSVPAFNEWIHETIKNNK